MDDDLGEVEAKLTSCDGNERAPSSERFTIFTALREAISEKRQKKSRRERLLQRLGFSK